MRYLQHDVNHDVLRPDVSEVMMPSVNPVKGCLVQTCVFSLGGCSQHECLKCIGV